MCPSVSVTDTSTDTCGCVGVGAGRDKLLWVNDEEEAWPEDGDPQIGFFLKTPDATEPYSALYVHFVVQIISGWVHVNKMMPSAQQLRKPAVVQDYCEKLLMMMMPFNCSYRNKNEPTAIYPSLGYSALYGVIQGFTSGRFNKWANAKSMHYTRSKESWTWGFYFPQSSLHKSRFAFSTSHIQGGGRSFGRRASVAHRIAWVSDFL